MKEYIDQRLREAIAMAHEPEDPGLRGVGTLATKEQIAAMFDVPADQLVDAPSGREIRNAWLTSYVVPLSLEAAADAGLPLSDEQRAILTVRQAARDAYRRSWRAKWHRILGVYGQAKHRLRHALDALRGVECERDDY